ncbi:MAG: PASTA domain-containing protein [Saprospiraceae bacterium]|nr:PASTA domain-containing protein [Saprospiraceae bacterium]MCB9326983.1 PASTA domain-containing protein [Lewinellaceae bacterium]
MEFTVEPKEQQKPDPKPGDHLKDKLKIFLNNAWNFLKSPVFLKNLGAIFLFLILCFWILTVLLKVYTHHNESMQVDNYVGMDLEDARRKIRKKDFRIEVKEIFGQPANKVLMQYPEPLSRVKEGRTIYLTVNNGKMEEVEIPDYSDMDNYDTYKKHLKARGLNHIIEKEFNAKYSENTILYITYKGKKISGLDLRRGVKAHKGDTIKCVITTRFSATVSLPNLVCQDYEAATFLLETHDLIIGRIFGDVADRNSAFVWKQDPPFEAGQQIQKGTQVDVYLTDTYPDGCN